MPNAEVHERQIGPVAFFRRTGYYIKQLDRDDRRLPAGPPPACDEEPGARAGAPAAGGPWLLCGARALGEQHGRAWVYAGVLRLSGGRDELLHHDDRPAAGR